MKKIMTVLGELPLEKLGVTMPHEHIICEINRFSGRTDNLLDDVQLSAGEVTAFKESGGSTLVDVTTEDIGRNPSALKRVSEISGVNIVMAAGYYAEETYPAYISEINMTELADRMIGEIRNGIDGTGIRPGIIGEIGCNRPYLLPAEEKVLKATARAHLETGLAITLHSCWGRPAPKQIAVLRKAGVPADRIIAGHADFGWDTEIGKDLDYYRSLLDSGVYLEFDQVGWEGLLPEVLPEDERVRRILKLLESGYAERLLFSTDLCRRSFYRASGGRGYGCVLDNFVPRLKECGISETQIQMILVENPKRILSF